MSLAQLAAAIIPPLLAAMSGVAAAWLTARSQKKGCRIKVDGVMEVEAGTREEAEQLLVNIVREFRRNEEPVAVSGA